MNSKKQTNSPPFATTFIAKYFAIPPFFHTFATAKRAHQALRYWFRSSVGLEQQPSKLWVLGSNPNGITWEDAILGVLFCYIPASYADIRHFAGQS